MPETSELAALTPPDSQATGSKWDGMGVGGGTVRAHWETDEDDDAEVVRVVVAAPPPPPPPPTRPVASNGHAPADASTQSAADPDLDFNTIRPRWPALRDEIWSNAIERAMGHSCELVGVEGRTLVVQMSSGNLLLLNDDKRRAIRGKLIEMLGRGADIRFIDDKTPYLPHTPNATAAPAAPPLPTSDPVIQAGLRYFGGPLERLPDE
jgi:hypothetical protein